MSLVLPNYLRREISRMLVAITILLVIVTFGGLLTDVLNKISRGQFPPGLLVSQMVLRIPQALVILLPLAGFLAVMLAYSRLYRDAEMAVLRGSGFSEMRLLGPALTVGVVLASGLALVALLLSPASRRVAMEMIDQANQRVLIAGLEPGRFVEVGSTGTVVYIGNMEGWNLGDVLMVKRGKDGEESVVRGRSGTVEQRADGRISVLHLKDGERVDLYGESNEIQRSAFGEAEVLLPDRMRPSRNDPASLELRDVRELLGSNEPAVLAELHARLGSPIQLVLLVLLAVPMARAAPRESGYDRLIVGFLLFMTYSVVLHLSKGLLALGKTPLWLGLWWVHALFAVIVLVLWLPVLRSHLAGRKALRMQAA
jgi:lipopolysaccharide export system permease protein